MPWQISALDLGGADKPGGAPLTLSLRAGTVRLRIVPPILALPSSSRYGKCEPPGKTGKRPSAHASRFGIRLHFHHLLYDPPTPVHTLVSPLDAVADELGLMGETTPGNAPPPHLR
jgi:hypothetical protein